MTAADTLRPEVQRHLRELPEMLRTALSAAADVEAAQAFTRDLAHRHYENFTVVSILVPPVLRQDFCNVYAFCRVADDLGDELSNRDASTFWLNRFREQTHGCYAGVASSHVFAALDETIRRHEIPIEPFLDLIDAFEQDQRVLRYESYEQLLDYCRRSADPVGRLVLYVCGYRDAQRQRLSDKTCTALQLANFWQDVRRDVDDRNRIYIPRESMARFGVSEAQIIEKRCDENFRALIRFEVERTEELFEQGERLVAMLRPAVRGQVSLFGQGGRAVLSAIRRRNYDTLTGRPAISRAQKARLLAATLPRVVLRRICPGGGS